MSEIEKDVEKVIQDLEIVCESVQKLENDIQNKVDVETITDDVVKVVENCGTTTEDVNILVSTINHTSPNEKVEKIENDVVEIVKSGGDLTKDVVKLVEDVKNGDEEKVIKDVDDIIEKTKEVLIDIETLEKDIKNNN